MAQTPVIGGLLFWEISPHGGVSLSPSVDYVLCYAIPALFVSVCSCGKRRGA